MSDSPTSANAGTAQYTSLPARILRGIFAATALLVMLLAYLLGQTYLLLVFWLVLAVLLTFPARLWSAIRGKVVWNFVLRPFCGEYRKYVWQFAVRASACGLSVVCLLMAAPRIAFANHGEFLAAMLMFGWIPAGILILLQLFPARHVSKSINLLYAAAATFLASQLLQVHVLSKYSERVAIQAPFRGEWVVFQGGRSSLINHHYFLASQRYALDLIAVQDGKHVQGDPLSLDAYACFDQPLFAPADGVVVAAVGDLPDQPIGGSDLDHVAGNHVTIDIGDGRFVMLAHLKQGSLAVKPGDRVRAGDLLAHCGNSGNTSEPHLHIQIQNGPEFYVHDLVAFPMRFKNATHVRGGESFSEQQGELRRNDRVIVASD